MAKSPFNSSKLSKLSTSIPKFLRRNKFQIIFIGALLAVSVYAARQQQQLQTSQQMTFEKGQQLVELEAILEEVQTELQTLVESDPHKTNLELQAQIKMIEDSYSGLISVYEQINDLEDQNYPEDQVVELRTQFALIMQQVSELKYEESQTTLAQTRTQINEYREQRRQEELKAAQAEAAKQAAELAAAAAQGGGDQAAPTAAVSNEPPANGYRRQVVNSDAGQFTVSLVAGDLGSTRVIVDTASASDCSNDCPVLPLHDYVGRNGAYAGINGTYFCPASYPSCAGKTNTFDLLVMNKDKTYFNSDNNVYSTNPGVIFSSGSVRFVGQVSQWGRDTGIDGMLSNFPLLVSGGNVVFGGDDDPKKGSKGNRSFVANRGGTVYIGVVHSATVAESARALRALGMENALNLDNGGSTALWFGGGYKVGPGRALPNVILFTVK